MQSYIGPYNQVIIEREAFWKYKPKYPLNPCPRCGARRDKESRDVHTSYAGSQEGWWYISCSKCGYSIRRHIETDAVEEWNRGEET